MGICECCKHQVDNGVNVVDRKDAAQETAKTEQDQGVTDPQSAGDAAASVLVDREGESDGEASGMETVVDTVVDEITADANVAAGYEPEVDKILNEKIAKA